MNSGGYTSPGRVCDSGMRAFVGVREQAVFINRRQEVGNRILSFSFSRVWLGAVLALILAPAGCEREAREAPEDAHAGHAHGPGAQTDDHSAGPKSDWCYGHGVPESVCTRCNPALIAEFKARGDWCAEHGLPESQCVLCNPEVEAKWAALRPQAEPPSPAADARGVSVERVAGSLRPVGDPLCDVEDNIIRFIDATIAGKAGIEVTPARKQRMSALVECPAEVRYDDTRYARVTARAEGVVVHVGVDVGERVEEGATLAIIDSPTVGEAKADYIAAQGQWTIAKADLDRHNTIHDGIERMLAACSGELSSDELRKQYAEVRLGEYKSRLLGAHAQLELARRRYERRQSLTEGGVGSKDDLQAAQRDRDQAEAEFAAAHEAIEIEMETEHLALERALRVAEVSLDVARRRLRVLGLSDEEIVALGAGEDAALSRFTVRSPMGGEVVVREAVVGEAVTATESLFAVADTSRLWLLLSLEERDLVAVEKGDRVVFTVEGIPGQSFEGQIDWVSSAVEEPSRTVRARVPLTNPEGLLRANMFGRARIMVHEEAELLTVPESAVQSDGCCSIVFVQDGPTTYRPRKVSLGMAARGAVEVRSGLAVGDTVVTAGSFLLKTEVLKSSIGAGCCEVDPGR